MNSPKGPSASRTRDNAGNDLHQRAGAKRDVDRQIFAALLGMGQMNGDVVLRHGLDADPVRPLHLEPIHADILDFIVFEIIGIPADDAGLVDIESTVAPVETE